MRAVNGEHLKLLSFDAPHPTGNLSRWTIPGMGVWITVLCEAGLVLGETFYLSQGNPGFKRTCTSEAGEKITEYGNRHSHRCDPIKEETELEQK
jgi:hypothetical protein